MSTIDPQTEVAQLVLERPARARAFERLGIDYCCGGRRSLAEACAEQGLDPATASAVLAAVEEAPADGEENWSEADLDTLCAHIVEVHHARMLRELPRLSGLLEKCVRAHVTEQPELAEIQHVFELLRAELEVHMQDEERELFPHLDRLDPELVADLESEHDQAGALLRRLRELSGGYDLEAALCNTHRATLDALRELELDLHEHIHEENNILFPRALAAAAPAER